MTAVVSSNSLSIPFTLRLHEQICIHTRLRVVARENYMLQQPSRVSTVQDSHCTVAVVILRLASLAHVGIAVGEEERFAPRLFNINMAIMALLHCTGVAASILKSLGRSFPSSHLRSLLAKFSMSPCETLDWHSAVAARSEAVCIGCDSGGGWRQGAMVSGKMLLVRPPPSLLPHPESRSSAAVRRRRPAEPPLLLLLLLNFHPAAAPPIQLSCRSPTGRDWKSKKGGKEKPSLLARSERFTSLSISMKG